MQLDSWGWPMQNREALRLANTQWALALLDGGMVRVGCATDCQSCRSFLSSSDISNTLYDLSLSRPAQGLGL